MDRVLCEDDYAEFVILMGSMIYDKLKKSNPPYNHTLSKYFTRLLCVVKMIYLFSTSQYSHGSEGQYFNGDISNISHFAIYKGWACGPISSANITNYLCMMRNDSLPF